MPFIIVEHAGINKEKVEKYFKDEGLDPPKHFIEDPKVWPEWLTPDGLVATTDADTLAATLGDLEYPINHVFRLRKRGNKLIAIEAPELLVVGEQRKVLRGSRRG